MATHNDLYELVAELKQRDDRDWSNAIRFIMKAVFLDQEKARKRQRKRTVQLLRGDGQPARGGKFKIPQDVLAQAEIIERD